MLTTAIEAMHVYMPTVNRTICAIAVNIMVAYCKACGHYILSIKHNRRLSCGVIADWLGPYSKNCYDK